MGIGYSEDLVVCVALGVDMYDCVFPTRTAVSDKFIFLFLFYELDVCMYIYSINYFC